MVPVVLTITTICCLLIIGAYVHPITRPWVRRYAWLAVFPFALLLGFVLVAALSATGRREDLEEGEDPTEASRKLIASLADGALAESAAASAELERRRKIAAAQTTEARAELVEWEEELQAALSIDDASRRRAELLRLSGG